MVPSLTEIPFNEMKKSTRSRKAVLRKVLALAGCLLATWCIRAAAQEQPDSLVLTPERAIAFALERSLVLKGARFGPQIAALQVRSANTAWSPRLSGSAGISDAHTPPLSTFDPQSGPVARQIASGVGVSQLLPWGTSYTVEWDAARLTGNNPLALYNPQLTTNGAVTITQHLLRGLTIDEARANRLVSLKGQTVSDAELASAVAATTYSVLRAYWTWIYAREYLATEQQSLALARGLLRDDRERASLGKIAAVDVVEAEAEVARRSDVILSATKDVANAEDELRLLIFAPTDPEQNRPLAPPSLLPDTDMPAASQDEVIVRALDSRHDLRILRTALDIDDITVKRLRNERLPDAALVLSYTGEGAAGVPVPSSSSPVAQRSFSSAWNDLAHFRYPSWSAGISVSWPIRSQAAAEAAKASVKRSQDETLLRSAEQQVATEVRSVVRTVDANRQRLPLTINAVALAERRLEAEQRKFVVGLSTSFLVIQAQRDLTASKERQVQSVLDYRLSLADLQTVETIPVFR